MSVSESPQPRRPAVLPIHLSDTPPQPSINQLTDSISSNGLGTVQPGLVSKDEDFEQVEDLLPLHQRMSPVMVAAHASVNRSLGTQLANLTLAELQALKTQVTLQEKQLLTTANHSELFAEISPNEINTAGTAAAETTSLQPQRTDKLNLLEYTQIRQENAHLSRVVCVRATADLVKTLRQPDAPFEIPGRRQGQTPLAAATSFVASVLKLPYSAVDKRVTAAAAMWPSMRYRRSRIKAPHIAAHLEQGRIPLESAIAAHDKLANIRQAVRRAGGDEKAADDLVQHKEREFLPHAMRNSSHTFSRFAKSRSDAVTNELIGPSKSLTNEQIKHEKGIFYDAPIGDSLHRLTLVVDDAEFLQLAAIREFATKLDSAISTMRAQTHDTAHRSSASPTDDQAGDEVTNNPRITPEDIELGIGQLFDGQTKAERWLNTLLDFTSAGLMLHKTYDPTATAEEQLRRNEALQKAAEHSEVISDILEIQSAPETTASPAPEQASVRAPGTTTDDPLAAMVPAGYQLLRPNLDLIVEIPLHVLLGTSATEHRLADETAGRSSELPTILDQLKREYRGVTAPVGSPSNIKIDYGLARQQACHQRLIPMVLGSAGQPLDVGRAQRSFSPAMRRALHVRDRGCVVPGCPRPSTWCEPHHLVPWAKGGSTSITNAALVCRAHHDAVHKELLQIHMEEDGRPSCSLPVSQDPTGSRYRNIFWAP